MWIFGECTPLHSMFVSIQSWFPFVASSFVNFAFSTQVSFIIQFMTINSKAGLAICLEIMKGKKNQAWIFCNYFSYIISNRVHVYFGQCSKQVQPEDRLGWAKLSKMCLYIIALLNSIHFSSIPYIKFFLQVEKNVQRHVHFQIKYTYCSLKSLNDYSDRMMCEAMLTILFFFKAKL